jgi:hypothetical protein
MILSSRLRIQPPLAPGDRSDEPGNTKGGSITIPLTSCLTGLESALWQLTFFCFYLPKRPIQTSQTGGQWYSDTSPCSIPWINALRSLSMVLYNIVQFKTQPITERRHDTQHNDIHPNDTQHNELICDTHHMTTLIITVLSTAMLSVAFFLLC